jgi:hypothetical protein
LASNAAKSGEALFQLACVNALCSFAAGKDSTLDMDERRLFSDQFANSSMQFLTQAQLLGYFKDSANVDSLLHEADLDSLRSRPEFQRLVNEVDTKVKTP